MRLHRYLLGFPDLQVDHIDRDTMNNRRSNLRVVTQSQNMANLGLRKGSKVPFKGVSINAGKYVATCNSVPVGTFPTAIQAALAYDAAAVIHFGEHAATNKSLGLLA